MKNILIDSDVLLDYFFDRTPFSDSAATILTLCQSGKIKGFVTPVIVSNIYYLLKKTASKQKVKGKLKQLLVFIEILSMDQNIVYHSLESDFSDFEDALQNFSALANGTIDIIVTRNIKDYKLSQLSVLTPDLFLKTLVA